MQNTTVEIVQLSRYVAQRKKAGATETALRLVLDELHAAALVENDGRENATYLTGLTADDLIEHTAQWVRLGETSPKLAAKNLTALAAEQRRRCVIVKEFAHIQAVRESNRMITESWTENYRAYSVAHLIDATAYLKRAAERGVAIDVDIRFAVLESEQARRCLSATAAHARLMSVAVAPRIVSWAVSYTVDGGEVRSHKATTVADRTTLADIPKMIACRLWGDPLMADRVELQSLRRL